MRKSRPSLPRIVREIKAHKRAIAQHVDELVRLRDELWRIDGIVDSAQRSLQEAINDLCQIK